MMAVPEEALPAAVWVSTKYQSHAPFPILLGLSPRINWISTYFFKAGDQAVASVVFGAGSKPNDFTFEFIHPAELMSETDVPGDSFLALENWFDKQDDPGWAYVQVILTAANGFERFIDEGPKHKF